MGGACRNHLRRRLLGVTMRVILQFCWVRSAKRIGVQVQDEGGTRLPHSRPKKPAKLQSQAPKIRCLGVQLKGGRGCSAARAPWLTSSSGAVL